MTCYVDALWAVAVLSGVASIGYADFAAQTVSLGFLYIFPLALSAMFQSLRTAVVLALICVAIRETLGPFDHTGFDLLLRTLLTTVDYLFVVIVVHRMTSQRRQLNEVVKEMKHAAEVQLPQGPFRIKGLDMTVVVVKIAG